MAAGQSSTMTGFFIIFNRGRLANLKVRGVGFFGDLGPDWK